ncbi:MAG: transposase [Magnetospiraceae bacterium]
MARIARIVIPGIPHHVTQRGNRRETVFFDDDDFHHYKALLWDAAEKTGTEVWAYCLMPNHVHLILVPRDEDGLRATVADAHRRYTRRINARNKWTGHLWQGRFGSVAMDEAHLANAVRYVSMIPVRARLVDTATDWQWSSARAHVDAKDDGLVRVDRVLTRIPDFAALLESAEDAQMTAALRLSETTGRPIGAPDWIGEMEERLGRRLSPRKRGRKPNAQN